MIKLEEEFATDPKDLEMQEPIQIQI